MRPAPTGSVGRLAGLAGCSNAEDDAVPTVVVETPPINQPVNTSTGRSRSRHPERDGDPGDPGAQVTIDHELTDPVPVVPATDGLPSPREMNWPDYESS